MNRRFGIHPLLGPAIIFNALLIKLNKICSSTETFAIPSARLRKTRRQAP